VLSAKAHSILECINPTRKAIKNIRDKAVAHQDGALSQPQVYAQSRLNLPSLVKISDASLEVAICLRIARNMRKKQFVTGHIDLLRAMLKTLRVSPR
jgi:hypothetical protein